MSSLGVPAPESRGCSLPLARPTTLYWLVVELPGYFDFYRLPPLRLQPPPLQVSVSPFDFWSDSICPGLAVQSLGSYLIFMQFFRLVICILIFSVSSRHHSTQDEFLPSPSPETPSSSAPELVFVPEGSNFSDAKCSEKDQASSTDAPQPRFALHCEDSSRNGSGSRQCRRILPLAMPLWTNKQKVGGELRSLPQTMDFWYQTQNRTQSLRLWCHRLARQSMAELGRDGKLVQQSKQQQAVLWRPHPDVRLQTVDQWRWGASVRKPTGLMSLRIPYLMKSMFACVDKHAKYPRDVAIGKDRSGEFKTAICKEYPPHFSAGLARAVIDQFCADLRHGRRRDCAFSDEDLHRSQWLVEAAQASAVVPAHSSYLPDYQGR